MADRSNGVWQDRRDARDRRAGPRQWPTLGADFARPTSFEDDQIIEFTDREECSNVACQAKIPDGAEPAASDAERLVDGSRARLWIHGHTHDSFDYFLNGTRVVCNPRGYAKDTENENPLFDANFIVEIDSTRRQ